MINKKINFVLLFLLSATPSLVTATETDETEYKVKRLQIITLETSKITKLNKVNSIVKKGSRIIIQGRTFYPTNDTNQKNKSVGINCFEKIDDKQVDVSLTFLMEQEEKTRFLDDMGKTFLINKELMNSQEITGGSSGAILGMDKNDISRRKARRQSQRDEMDKVNVFYEERIKKINDDYKTKISTLEEKLRQQTELLQKEKNEKKTLKKQYDETLRKETNKNIKLDNDKQALIQQHEETLKAQKVTNHRLQQEKQVLIQQHKETLQTEINKNIKLEEEKQALIQQHKETLQTEKDKNSKLEESMKQQKKQYKNDKDSLDKRLQEVNNKLEHLEIDLKQANNEKEEVRKENEELKKGKGEEVVTLSSANKKLRKEKDTLEKNHLRDLQLERDANKKINNEFEKEKDKLNKEKEANTHLKEQLEKRNHEFDMLNLQLKDELQKASTTTKSLEESNNKLKTLKDNINSLNEKNLQMDKNMKKSKEEITVLITKHQDEQKRITELQKEIDEAKVQEVIKKTYEFKKIGFIVLISFIISSVTTSIIHYLISPKNKKCSQPAVYHKKEDRKVEPKEEEIETRVPSSLNEQTMSIIFLEILETLIPNTNKKEKEYILSLQRNRKSNQRVSYDVDRALIQWQVSKILSNFENYSTSNKDREGSVHKNLSQGQEQEKNTQIENQKESHSEQV